MFSSIFFFIYNVFFHFRFGFGFARVLLAKLFFATFGLRFFSAFFFVAAFVSGSAFRPAVFVLDADLCFVFSGPDNFPFFSALIKLSLKILRLRIEDRYISLSSWFPTLLVLCFIFLNALLKVAFFLILTLYHKHIKTVFFTFIFANLISVPKSAKKRTKMQFQANKHLD